MRKLYSKPSKLKRGNLAMVMVISIAVVLTMLALSAFLVMVVKNQERAQESSDRYSNIDASISAIEIAGEQQIKNYIQQTKIESMMPPMHGGAGPMFNLDGNQFVNRFGNDIKTMVENLMVVECDVSVSFMTDIKYKIYDQPEQIFDLIVVSLTSTDGTVYNVGFYAESIDGMGAAPFERGDFVFVWIT